MTLRELISRFGLNTPQEGAIGMPAITYAQPGRTSPQTVPLIPGVPGLILAPEDRPLSREESRHESIHSNLGLPGALAGVLGAEAFGVGPEGSYLAPDEVLAYAMQEESPSTARDRLTIRSLVKALERGGRGGRYTRGVGSLMDLLR